MVIRVRDETLGGRAVAEWELPMPAGSITAGELIRLRVREEVARHNAELGGVFRGLVRPVGAEQVPDGFRLPADRRLDWEAQAEAACAAFGRNGFVLFVGDRQIDALTELVDLTGDPEIVFIRLMPLVGG